MILYLKKLNHKNLFFQILNLKNTIHKSPTKMTDYFSNIYNNIVNNNENVKILLIKLIFEIPTDQ